MKETNKMISNFLNMPFLLKLMFSVGFLSPCLVIFSVLKGDVIPGQSFDLGLGAAANIFELLLVIIFSIPTFFASVLMLKKYRFARHIYVLGWYLSCLSPLFLSVVWNYMDVFITGLSFNLLLGLVMFGYLFFASQVKEYVSSVSRTKA